jgi:hypothetical protein
MKRKWKITTAVVLLAVLSTALFLCGCGEKSLKVGTGGEGGRYVAYMNQFANFTTDEFKLNVQTTAGSAANLRLMKKGFLDAAIVQSDILHQAKEEEGNLPYSAITGLYTESLQIVTTVDSKIETVDDLKGCRVSVGEEESGVISNATQVLDFYGLSFNDIQVYNLSFEDSAKALKAGQIDAFFCMAGTPTGSVENLAKEADIRLLSFTDQEIARMQNKYPYYLPVTIPENTYEGVGEVKTIGVRAVLVVSNKLSESVAENLTKEVFEHSEELNEGITTDGAIDATFATEYITIPFHAGAAKYLRSLGVEVEENSSVAGETVFGGQD